MRISRRISLSFLVTALVLVICGASVAYVVAWRTVEVEVSRTLAQTAQSTALAIAEYIEEEGDLLRFAAGHESVIGLLRSKAEDPRRVEVAAGAKEVTDALLGSDSLALRISLVDSAGTVVLSAERTAGGSKAGPARANAGLNDFTSIPSIKFDESLNRPLISLSAPVAPRGHALGFVVADFALDPLYALLLDRVGLGDTGEAYLVDSQGRMLTPARFGESGPSARGDPEATAMLPPDRCTGGSPTAGARSSWDRKDDEIDAPVEVGTYEGYRGAEVLGTHIHLRGTDWWLFVEIEKEEALAPLRNLEITFAAMIALIPPIAWLVGWRVSKSVSRPLGELERAADTIGSGDLGCRTGMSSKDEVGELGSALDRMAVNLGQATATIDELREEIERRMRAEAALRSSQRKYRSLVDNIGIGISVISPEMRVLSLNTQMKRWFPKADPSEAPLCYEAFNDPPKTEVCSYCPTLKTLRDGGVHEAVSESRTPSGVQHFRIVSSPLLDDQGVVKAAIEAVEDVTALRRSHDALDAVQRERDRAHMYLDVAGVMMVVLDCEGKVTLINKKGCELLGYEEDEIIGRDWFDLIVSPATSEKQRMGYSSTMAGTSEVPGPLEHGVMTKSGEERFISWRTTILRDESGEPAGLLASGEDMTSRKKMERELIRLERLRAVGEMAAGISHNLNNVLVGVLGHAQLLRASIDDDEALGEVENVLSAARRAKALVEDLRRAVSADMEDELEPVELEVALREAIKETQPRWKDEPAVSGKPIDVQCRVSELPPVRATGSGIHDILVNLILNAVDAMPEGGTISIEAARRDDQVEIEVADTGEGMDERTRRRVFEPFFTTKAVVGTGLGLATAHSAVSRWGGRIDVSSAPGKGTTFHILLPIWDGPVPAVEEEEEQSFGPAETAGGRILIVDDEEMVVSVLRGLLSSRYEIDSAQDAAEALQLFESGRYDVVVIDLGLPDRPGNELGDGLKACDPSLATVLVTGWKVGESDPRLSSFDFRIMKPFADLSETQRVIRQAVRLHRERLSAPEGARLVSAEEADRD